MGYEALLVNGVDLTTIVSCIQVLDGIWAVSLPRGDDLTIPGVDGETWTDKPYAAGTLDVGLILGGTSVTQLNDQLRALKTLIQPGSLVSLQRHLSFTTGNEQHTAFATVQTGMSPTVSLLKYGKATVTFKLLSGLWYSMSTTSISVASGTYTGLGEARSENMTVTLAPNETLTNSTTGHRMGTTGLADTSTPVVVRVQDMTAFQGATNVSGSLWWTHRYPMRIVPGDNAFLYSGVGTASLVYYRAYL